MAGVDFPREEERLAELVGARGWAAGTTVLNDTFAVLRAGTEQGWGVAVVCGAGINCVGVAPDGRQSASPRSGRSPATGAAASTSGSRRDVGAARSFDGRGPKTTLESAVPAHFGLDTPHELAEAIHAERIAERRLLELSPVVFAEAEHDEVAAAIVDRLADEVVALARVALDRLGLTTARYCLAAGSSRGTDTLRCVERIRRGLPGIAVRLTGAAPIVGAALLALDEVGAGARGAGARLRGDELAGGGRWLRSTSGRRRGSTRDGYPRGRCVRPRHRRR